MIPYFSVDNIQFGPIGIQTWGFFASLGVLFALLMSLKRANKAGVGEEIIYDIFLIGLVSMVIGAKIFNIVFSSEPDISVSRIFSGGGFSFFGGVISSAAAIFLYLKHKKADVLKIADVLMPGILIALISVRIGCFLVYDHIGSVTDLPWGIGYTDGTFRHPVALYLILANIVIFSIIWYLEKRDKLLPVGAMLFIFILLYSSLRLLLDFIRCSDLAICDSRYYGLTYVQLILIPAIPLSLHIYRYLKFNSKENEQKTIE